MEGKTQVTKIDKEPSPRNNLSLIAKLRCYKFRFYSKLKPKLIGWQNEGQCWEGDKLIKE